MTTEQYQIGYEDGYSAGFDEGIKPAPTPQQPVALVTDYPVMGVKFSEASNYGCDLTAGTKLYTHSAPRQVPLTEDEIVNMISNVIATSKGLGVISIARAIEQAHGIK